ncbi:MAG TPA: GNAT family N-acetyltransferase [Methanoregulaceae archaeon]|nr:GNAT family N-acetyltransferase [Methanoregulaceae archaeon]
MEVELTGTTVPVKLRQMTREEADIVIDWAADEGWNPGLHDADAFFQTDPSGFFAIEAGKTLAGSFALVRYNDDFMFGGLYIVHPDYRGKGIGRAMLDFTRDYAADHNLGIDGVFAMQPVYQKAGFKFAYRNIRFEGIGGGNIDRSLTILRKVPFPRVLVYDSLHFPAVRENFLKHFIYQLDSTGFAAIEGDSLTGYGFVRKCRNGYKIGPLFADTEEIAEMIYSALASVAGKEPLFLDVPELNKAAVMLAQSHGMKEVFGTARMYTKKVPKLPLNQIFGVTTFELG